MVSTFVKQEKRLWIQSYLDCLAVPTKFVWSEDEPPRDDVCTSVWPVTASPKWAWVEDEAKRLVFEPPVIQEHLVAFLAVPGVRRIVGAYLMEELRVYVVFWIPVTSDSDPVQREVVAITKTQKEAERAMADDEQQVAKGWTRPQDVKKVFKWSYHDPFVPPYEP